MGDETDLTLRPERFIPGGEALVRIPEQPVTFVRGAIPGELVVATVTERKKQWRRAVATEILEASPHRVAAPCPHVARGCGGCDWQHLDPAHQLEAKTQIAIDAIRRGGGPDLSADPTVIRAGGSVSPTGYRTTIRVRGTDSGRAGLYAYGSHRVIDIGGCVVAHQGLHEVLETVRIDPGVELTLRISASTGQITAMWDGPPEAVSGLGSGIRIGPDAHLIETVSGVQLQVSAGSFFQSGPEAATLLVETVRRLAPEVTHARHLVDAYGGIGLFAATLADADAQITLIESSAFAVADAAVNLGRWVAAGRANLWEGPMEDTVSNWAESKWAVSKWAGSNRAETGAELAPVDVVIADPARHGLDKKGLSAVLATGAPVMVLVSCDPAAGARDLRLAVEAGFEVSAVEVLDLFPHTHHVELVTRLERRNGDSSGDGSAPYRDHA
jgi:23S rRNA (uracil1939-C5)-methyltransferase